MSALRYSPRHPVNQTSWTSAFCCVRIPRAHRSCRRSTGSRRWKKNIKSEEFVKLFINCLKVDCSYWRTWICRMSFSCSDANSFSVSRSLQTTNALLEWTLSFKARLQHLTCRDLCTSRCRTGAGSRAHCAGPPRSSARRWDCSAGIGCFDTTPPGGAPLTQFRCVLLPTFATGTGGSLLVYSFTPDLNCSPPAACSNFPSAAQPPFRTSSSKLEFPARTCRAAENVHDTPIHSSFGALAQLWGHDYLLRHLLFDFENLSLHFFLQVLQSLLVISLLPETIFLLPSLFSNLVFATKCQGQTGGTRLPDVRFLAFADDSSESKLWRCLETAAGDLLG